MKRKLKKKKSSNHKYILRNRWKILLVFSFLLLFLNIGYAALESSVEVKGTATAELIGVLFIENVSIKDSNNVIENELTMFDSTMIESNLKFQDDNYSYINYQIVIVNGTKELMQYTNETFNVDNNIKNIINYEITGDFDDNPYILPGERKIVNIVYKYREDAVAGDYSLNMQLNFTNEGSFYAKNNTEYVDLRNQNIGPINLKVINYGEEDITYNLKLNSNKFTLVDKNGNSLGKLQINKNTLEDIEVYLKANDNISFYKESYQAELSLEYDSNSINFGNITIYVNLTGEKDDLPVEIGPISLDMTNEVGTFDITWSRLDEGGAPVIDYVINLYKEDNTLIGTYHTEDDLTTYRLTNQAPGNYYAIIYGIDEAENSGESYITTATEETPIARKSPETEIRWERTITTNFTNLSLNGNTTVNLGDTYTATITATGNIFNGGTSAPETIQVIMNNHTLTQGTDYTWTGTGRSSSGTLTIPNITGDIEITASATAGTCLVEGTKIALANGKSKNIENINYNDLLKVWSYDTGTISYEYPIWIEKTKKTTHYQLTKFSDGTILKTVGYHGVFSSDYNAFVSVDDKEKFKVGTKIIKIENDKLKEVEVVSITNVAERVNYYHVVSTRYYNIIANGILTTDGTVSLSNLYGFDKNITWPKDRIIEKYNYSEFKNILPYYMFKGLRAEEGKVLENYGFTKEKFKYYLLKNQVNEDMWEKPIKNKNGNNIWKVSTSDNTINDMFEEGKKVKLPAPKKYNQKFIGWYNTADNKYYQIGDEITVEYGIHLIATYKQA